MLHELLALKPDAAMSSTLALWAAITGMVAGAALWLAGSRFSRSFLTLSAVSLGASVGTHLPRWCGWSINGMAPAILLAIGLGVAAYTMHRAWVGLALGLVLACWAAVGLWMLAHGSEKWEWPAVDASMTAPAYAGEMWKRVPEQVSRPLPYVCASAMVIGIMMTIVWPRVAVIALYSIAGLTLLVTTGLATVDMTRPQWLERVPSQTWAQLTILVVLLLVGASVQWWLAPKRASSGNADPRSSSTGKDAA